MRSPSAKDVQTVGESDRPRAKRRLFSRVPIWVRVSVITAVVLIGVRLSTMLVGASGVGERRGGHGSGDQMETNDGTGGDRTGGDHTGGGHGPGPEHTGGAHGPGTDHGS